MSYWTYQDNIDHMLGWAGAQSGSVVEKQFARRATLEALREIGNRYAFSYYLKVDRINTESPYQTGTVTYTTSNRYMTLTGGTWPTWGGDNTTVLVNRYPYKVTQMISSTVLLMDADMSPTDDTTVVNQNYQLFKDTYTLPADLVSLDKLYSISNNWILSYISQQKWLEYSRYWRQPSTVRCWTIAGDEQNPGRLAMKLNWAPSSQQPFDFIYRRRPRDLSIANYETGTVAISGTAVTGTGTTFTPAMVGSVFRVRDSSNSPTGWEGEYPPLGETLVAGYTNATTITLKDNLGTYASGSKYVISDPVDVEVGSMLNMFKACSEYHHARTTHKRDVTEVRAAYEQELRLAMGADARYAGAEAAGTNQTGLWTGLAAGVPLPWLRSDQ